MGIRGELYSTKFVCDSRTYFFNVKQNRNGDVFLSIVESKPSEGETFDRRSVVVFGEQMEGFVRAFQSALKFMNKTGNKVEPDLDSRGFPVERDMDRERRPRDFDEQRPAPRRRYGEERRPGDQRPSGEQRYHGEDRKRSVEDRGRYGSDNRRQGEDRRPEHRYVAKGPASRDRSEPAPRPASPKPVKRIVVRKPKKPGDEA